MKRQIMAATAAIMLAGCAADPYTGQQRASNTAVGAGLGAGAGALAGLLVAGDGSSRDKRNAALIGAGIGALAGGGVGVYMDNQEAELRAQLQGTGVSVTRQGDNIILNMPSNITFQTDQSDIQSGFYPTLNSVALVLQKFDSTLIDVFGHTDSTGSDAYNYDLSQRRAQSVVGYLGAQGVNPQRFAARGFGETRPIATNDTEAGRSQNRRVEILLVPRTRA